MNGRTPLTESNKRFPAFCRTAGYQTAVIGKWHLYSDPVGFDHWDVIDNVFEQGTYYNPAFRSSAWCGRDDRLRRGPGDR